jgi:hypothetical protein
MNEPQFCYVVIPGAAPGERIGVIERSKKGYYLTDFDSPKASDKTIRDFVTGMNARLGVDATEAQAMLDGSMFGDDPAEETAARREGKWKARSRQGLSRRHSGRVDLNSNPVASTFSEGAGEVV